MRNILNRKAIAPLNKAVGGLGLPSKMPGFAYGISAENCKLGAVLAQQAGTVCSGCYALKANYRYPSVKASHAKREITLQNLDNWALNMAQLLAAVGEQIPTHDWYFRFHDSGDLQSWEHLEAITFVARRNPLWRFWLPTREVGIVKQFLDNGGQIPQNLVVRISAIKLGGEAPKSAERLGCPTSTVGAGTGYKCPARQQNNSCGDCRACWEIGVENIDYTKH